MNTRPEEERPRTAAGMVLLGHFHQQDLERWGIKARSTASVCLRRQENTHFVFGEKYQKELKGKMSPGRGCTSVN